MEEIKVRYYSKTGNTKAVAEYIASAIGIEAKSITEDSNTKCKLLFLGGAPYANIMSSKLREFAEGLNKEEVSSVALFTTSNWSRRTVRALKGILRKKGIKVYDDFLYVHMLAIKVSESKAKEFALNILNLYKEEK